MAKNKEKASERAERLLMERILAGSYPPGSALPGERDLSKELEVARPALREALQRLARDGWLVIQQGKPTEVSDYMREGSLNVLTGLMEADLTLVPDFVPNLLEVWSLLAPSYTQAAIENDSREVHLQIFGYQGLADRPRPYARADWRLHRMLIDLSGNPVYGLLLNAFRDFHMRLAARYFHAPENRAEVRAFWDRLYNAALLEDGERAADLMWQHMLACRRMWPELDITAWIEDEMEEDGEYQDEDDDR